MSGHTPLPDLRCPYCSVQLLCADAMDSNRSTTPTDGAVSICVECAEPAMFVDGPFGLAFRKPTADERAWIMAEIGPTLMMYKMIKRDR